jgi:hypothetical protein
VAEGPQASAHLLEYLPESGDMVDHGDVLTALGEAGVLREGEAQAKIHTRILQAPDGCLYFASLDEQGADLVTGSSQPTWGGHLWRLHLPEYRWEHLASTPEALVAIAASGHWVYALGFFGHTLYQFDCETGLVRSVIVGVEKGHISRNLVSDAHGHAYVPRVRFERDLATRLLEAPGRYLATLVEYDEDLREVKETMLEHYTGSIPADSHGLTAAQPLVDGSIVVATAFGYLYRIIPSEAGAARVEPMGWFHPDGEKYVPALFTFAGRRYLVGLATGDRRNEKAPRGFDWVVNDLDTGVAAATRLTVAGPDAPWLGGALLYGSVTCDDQGRFYVAGWTDRHRPLILRMTCR